MSDTPTRDGPASGGSIRYSRIVDLSHPVHPGIPRWPGDPFVEFLPHSEIEGDGYFLRRFSMGEHSGTHLTAAASFFGDGATIDTYQAADLVKQAVILDVRAQCERDPDYGLSRSDLTGWERQHGLIPAGSLAFLHTGWPDRWNESASYLGQDNSGRLHFPGFGIDAARVLLDDRRAAGLGSDTAGVDRGTDQAYAVSKLVLAKPRIVLENLTGLELLPATGAVVVIGLPRLVGGSGAPVSVTAFLP